MTLWKAALAIAEWNWYGSDSAALLGEGSPCELQKNVGTRRQFHHPRQWHSKFLDLQLVCLVSGIASVRPGCRPVAHNVTSNGHALNRWVVEVSQAK
jgi:hypothetical protein